MMITVYGAGDDLVVVDGCDGGDELPVADVAGRAVCWTGTFTCGNDQMLVSAIFDGCWHFAVGQVDESLPLPDWGNGTGQRHDTPYSAELRIDAPDGTRLAYTWPGPDGT